MHWRRFFQFRLRTLLIVATLLCVALVVFVLPARRKWQAVRELQERGVLVNFERGAYPSAWETFSHNWLGCHWGPPIRAIDFYDDGPLTERDRHLIATCQPHMLDLYADQFQSAPELAWVTRLPALRFLVLYWYPTEAQLRSLQPAAHLEVLHICAPESDAAWRALASLTQVRTLHILSGGNSAEGLSQLATMRHLQELHFSYDTDLTDAQLAQLRAALPQCDVKK